MYFFCSVGENCTKNSVLQYTFDDNGLSYFIADQNEPTFIAWPEFTNLDCDENYYYFL